MRSLCYYNKTVYTTQNTKLDENIVKFDFAMIIIACLLSQSTVMSDLEKNANIWRARCDFFFAEWENLKIRGPFHKD